MAGRVGLMEAVRYARRVGISAIEARVVHLAATLREALTTVRGVTVHDLGQRKCGIVTFTKEGTDPARIATTLRESGMNVSVSTLPYARLDLENRRIASLVRASVHYFNTEDEIARFVTRITGL